MKKRVDGKDLQILTFGIFIIGLKRILRYSICIARLIIDNITNKLKILTFNLNRFLSSITKSTINSVTLSLQALLQDKKYQLRNPEFIPYEEFKQRSV